MRATLYALLLLPLLFSTASAAEDIGMPTAAERAYEAYSRNTEFTLGHLKLSTTSARFTVLSGTMRLEAAGTMPPSDSFETGGARVFRVLNADEFFKTNAGKNGFCGEPVRWLGVRSIGKGEIRVTFLTLDDFRAYRSDGPGLCSGDSYALK